jgi:hypothetical protein
MPDGDVERRVVLATMADADELRTTVRRILDLLADTGHSPVPEPPADMRRQLVEQRASAAALRVQLAEVRARCEGQRRQLATLREQLGMQCDRIRRSRGARAARLSTRRSVGTPPEPDVDHPQWAVTRQQRLAELRQVAAEKRKIASDIRGVIRLLWADNGEHSMGDRRLLADERHRLADAREALIDERERLADERERLTDTPHPNPDGHQEG